MCGEISFPSPGKDDTNFLTSNSAEGLEGGALPEGVRHDGEGECVGDEP